MLGLLLQELQSPGVVGGLEFKVHLVYGPTQKVVSSQWPVNMRVENSGPLVLGWEL